MALSAPLQIRIHRPCTTDEPAFPVPSPAYLNVNDSAAHMPHVEPERHHNQSPGLVAFLSLPVWTIEETAYYLRIQAQTIRKAISQKGAYHGLIPRRFGRRWYFKAAEVRAAMEIA